MIGNAEMFPFSPRRYLYHAYMAYMRANGLSKPVSLTRFGIDMPGATAEHGKPYEKKKTKQGTRSTLRLTPDAEEWMPRCIETTGEKSINLKSVHHYSPCQKMLAYHKNKR